MRNPSLLLWLTIALIISTFLSLFIGPLSWKVLFNDSQVTWIVFETLRLPRTLLALLTGAMLGLTGATLQGYLKNPLADAGLIGVSSAASFGVVLALSCGISVLWSPLFGMMAALGLMLIFYGISLKRPNTLSLILMGLAFNSLFGALTSLTLNLSANPYKNLELLFWLLGSFTNQSLESIFFIIPFLVAGSILLWRQRNALDALTLGEEMAETFGYSLKNTTRMMIMGVALCIGPLTALGGTIGFVGLIVPHILRHFTKPTPSALLIPSALGGALLCLGADILIRLLPTNTEIKIGVITSLLGAPFFLFLLLNPNRSSHDSF